MHGAPEHGERSGVVISNSSEAKCWFAAPRTFHACKAVMTRNLTAPEEKRAGWIVKKLNVNWGHDPGAQIQRILTDADGVGANVLKVVDSVATDCDC